MGPHVGSNPGLCRLMEDQLIHCLPFSSDCSAVVFQVFCMGDGVVVGSFDAA